MSLTKLWFECDSALVCAAFNVMTMVSFMLCNRWNTRLTCGKIRFMISHIFRGGNACTDKLANLDFIYKSIFIGITSFHLVPS